MTANGWANSNLRTQLERLLKKAEIQPWPRLFHSLRASRETELVSQFPIHVVSHWLGNTPAIAMRHYLLVTEADFAKAACVDGKSKKVADEGDAKSDARSTQKPTQHTSAGASTHSQESTQVLNEEGDMQRGAISCIALHTPLVEVKGLPPKNPKSLFINVL